MPRIWIASAGWNFERVIWSSFGRPAARCQDRRTRGPGGVRTSWRHLFKIESGPGSIGSLAKSAGARSEKQKSRGQDPNHQKDDRQGLTDKDEPDLARAVTSNIE